MACMKFASDSEEMREKVKRQKEKGRIQEPEFRRKGELVSELGELEN